MPAAGWKSVKYATCVSNACTFSTLKRCWWFSVFHSRPSGAVCCLPVLDFTRLIFSTLLSTLFKKCRKKVSNFSNPKVSNSTLKVSKKKGLAYCTLGIRYSKPCPFALLNWGPFGLLNPPTQENVRSAEGQNCSKLGTTPIVHTFTSDPYFCDVTLSRSPLWNTRLSLYDDDDDDGHTRFFFDTALTQRSP